MADKRITDLPLISSGNVSQNDVLPIVDVAQDITNKIEVSQLKSYILSGVTNFIDITHSELLNLQKTNNLTEGQWYRITDFQTKYKVLAQRYGDSFGEPLISGPIEPLYVRALSENELQRESYSETYPQDIVYYKIEDPFNEFGKPITYNISFQNVPIVYYNQNIFFQILDSFDNSYIGGCEIFFDGSGNVTDIQGLYPYYKKNHVYKLSNYDGIFGEFTPLTIEYFGGDKGYIYRRTDTERNISVQGDWRTIKYRRWSAEVLQINVTSGTFNDGEILLGSTTNTRGVISLWNGVDDLYYIKRSNVGYSPTFGGQFQVGETVTGERSGAQGTIVSIQMDEVYDWGKPSLPALPGEVNDINFYYLDNPNVFPIAGYSNQTLTFNQDTSNASGSGISVEVVFEGSGYISSYTILNGGQNYTQSETVETNDLGFGKLYFQTTQLKSCELYPGISVYVVSGTALYNGIEYSAGTSFVPFDYPYHGLNPLEYFQQVGPTPLLVKKPFYGVCFDNGLPYKDLTLFNEQQLKLGGISNVNFTADNQGDGWRFKGVYYERSLTYLCSVIQNRINSTNVGVMYDCSANTIFGLRSIDPTRPGRIFNTVFGNIDGCNGNILFDTEMSDSIFCHGCNGGPLKLGNIYNFISTNNSGISDVEISEIYNTTLGNGGIVRSKLGVIRDSFIKNNIIDTNLIGEYTNLSIYGELKNNNISIQDGRDITINTNFRNNDINVLAGRNIIANSEFFNNNITSIVFYDCLFQSNFVNNQISVELFRDNIFSGFTAFNTINNSLFRNNTFQANFESNTFKGGQFINNTNIINNFQRNNIEATVNFTDFSLATHVYGNYNCNIFENSGGNVKLSYYNPSNVLTIKDITE